MKLRTIVRLMLAFVSLVLVAPLNSLPVSAVEAKPAQPAPEQSTQGGNTPRSLAHTGWSPVALAVSAAFLSMGITVLTAARRRGEN